MKRSTLLYAILSALCGITAVWGNGWSFEPVPRVPEVNTNEVRQATPRVGQKTEPVTRRSMGEEALAALLDERLQYSVGSRLNPLQSVEYLVRENPKELFWELQTRDGKSAAVRGLKLALREYGVRRMGVGGVVGDLLGGRKIGTVRPSLFEVGEGIAGWHLTRVSESRFFWEGDPVRENPYAALGYRGRDWWGEPRWELRTRFAAEDWQHPRLEAGGTLYLKRNIAFETGVQLRSEVERNGNSFTKGDDQRLAVFVGSNLETRYGNLYLGVSAPVARVSAVYWLRW